MPARVSSFDPARLAYAVVAGLLVASLSAGLAPSTASAAKGGPRADLVVAKAALSATTVRAGATVRVTHGVRNTGGSKAKASTTRFYLGTARLAARRAVPAVRPRRTVLLPAVTLAVPAGTTPGRYVVRACADDLRTVGERSERNNCRSAGTLVVQARAGQAPPVPQLPAMDTTGLELDSFATTATWPASEDSAVRYLKLFCQAGQQVRPMTAAQAVASLRAQLQAEAEAGMDALAASTAYDDTGALQELATAGVTQGSPGLALAALLRAADLEPAVGTHQVNAASLAVALGHPNEALALLDAAAGRTFRDPAMGIPQQAIAATVRGQALVLTGRHEQARGWFSAARAAAPVLTEADAGLATVEACAGNDVKAARFIRKSRKRSHQKTTVEEEPTRPDPMSAIDLGAGRTTQLRQVPLPATTTQLINMLPNYEAMLDDYSAEIDDHNEREAVIDDLLDEADAASTAAERERRRDLIHLAHVATTAQIEALEDETDELSWDLRMQREDFWGGGTGEAPYVYGEILDDAIAACDTDACFDQYMNDHCRPALVSAHQKWLGTMQQLQDAENQRIALVSQLMSSIAAHIAEPAGHDAVLLTIESLESIAHGGLTTEAASWGRMAEIRKHHCVEPLPTPTPGAEDEPAVGSAGPCTETAKKVSVKFSLGPSEIKINCEKITQEFAVEVLPLVQAFVEVKYHLQSGTMTVVAGSKAKGGVVVEGSFKSGVYVSVDTRQGGSIKDVGWQVGPELTGTAGPMEVEFHQEEMDFSFIAGLKGD